MSRLALTHETEQRAQAQVLITLQHSPLGFMTRECDDPNFPRYHFTPISFSISHAEMREQDTTKHAMPEYACEPPFDGNYWDWPQPVPDKYDTNSFFCSSYNNADNSVGKWMCCGFLKDTATNKPVSFYLAVFALVYCVVLTVVFAIWACTHPRLPAVSRRVVPARLPPQVVIQPTA